MYCQTENSPVSMDCRIGDHVAGYSMAASASLARIFSALRWKSRLVARGPGDERQIIELR